nr:hypothetical protein [uncultured Roseateles sp.]
MSYSLSIRGASKVLAMALVAAELEKAAALSIAHQVDKEQALAAADSFVNLLPDDDSKDVVVAMSGGLSGQWSGVQLERVSGVSFSVQASLVDRPVAVPAD